MQAEFVGFSLAVTPGRACYVPLGHRVASGAFDFGDGQLKQVPVAEALAVLRPLLEDPAVLKIGQNLKYDCLVLARHGIALAPLDDTMLLSYALDAGRGQQGMDALAERHLKHACMPFTQVLEHAPGARKSDKTFAQVPLDKATEYAGEDADVTLRLWMALKPRLAAERMTAVYETLERPLVCVLADMERRRQGGPEHSLTPQLHLRAAHRPAGGRGSTSWPGTSSTWARPSSLASSCSIT
jgi:DNA polymerase-1